MNNNKKFREGDELAHKDNLAHKITVYEIFTETIMVADGYSEEKKCFIKKPKKVIRGIGCHWFENGQLQTHRFHSRELVPWEVAQKGASAVHDYLTNIN
jgi:uncharacterized protein YodC (DUF2158 family)